MQVDHFDPARFDDLTGDAVGGLELVESRTVHDQHGPTVPTGRVGDAPHGPGHGGQELGVSVAGAGDLHDTVGQMMSAVKMNLSIMENEIPFEHAEQREAYRKVLSLVDDSCREVRTVSHNIMPNALLKLGLANGVRDFINHIDTRVIKTDLFIDGLDEERLDANVEAVLYRVLQECVNNVVKHANANKLDICVIRDKDGISVTLEDNGKGFDTRNMAKFEGIGLKNIITRINYLKGTIEWHSSPDKGTLVEINVPC